MDKKALQAVTLFVGLLGIHPCIAETDPAKIPVLGKTTAQSTQQKMTPREALLLLKEGNQRFLSNSLISRDYLKQAKLSSYGQYPFAVVLNCMDSRSVPEFIFDQGLADLFTLRVAGNVLNDDILGSMEYATKVVGSRLIVVLGHTSCGAVSSACEGVELGHITDILNKIQPQVKPTMKSMQLDNCKDYKLIDGIAKANALSVMRDIQDKSPIIKSMVESGQIGIVAGLHDIKTGKVEFFEEGRSVPG
jgi:carbonic anhydrase